MSSVTFYKICELLLVVIYAFGADYMMTSVLGRRFVPKRKIPFFNFQRLAYILTLATTFLFLSHGCGFSTSVSGEAQHIGK